MGERRVERIYVLSHALLLLVVAILTSQAEWRLQQGNTIVTHHDDNERQSITDVLPVQEKDADYVVKIQPYEGRPVVVLYREGVLEDTATIVSGDSEFTFRIDKTKNADIIRLRIS